MSKFNTKTTQRGASPIKVSPGVVSTYEGATARALDEKSELFSLAVTNMVGQDTFYEDRDTRDSRYVTLIDIVTTVDPKWVADMLVWLRTEANMRSAALVGAAEYVRARGPNGRAVVRSVLQRADEPGELLAYWTNKHGRKIPQPIKRGIADAIAGGLYNEYSIQKYDSAARGFRFADVIQLTHPKPKDSTQEQLLKYALDRRYQGSEAVPGEGLSMLQASDRLDAYLKAGVTADSVSAEQLREAGWTWERLSSYGAFTKETWEAIIPTMGYMALLRNLRNFEQAGVSQTVMEKVQARLSDPEQVARSRQLPYRFYSAYREVSSDRTKVALGEALRHSFKNIDLPGRNLVLIDVSGSMQSSWSQSKVIPADVASIMGVAVASGQDADVVAFATYSKQLDIRPGGSPLDQASRIPGLGRELGYGTNISGAIRKHYNGHDRVLVFTDMQSHDNGGVSVPTYVFDLAGYGRVPELGTNTVIFTGWNDVFVRMIPLIEEGRQGNWPWVR